MPIDLSSYGENISMPYRDIEIVKYTNGIYIPSFPGGIVAA
jgi:hypothetical protein